MKTIGVSLAWILLSGTLFAPMGILSAFGTVQTVPLAPTNLNPTAPSTNSTLSITSGNLGQLVSDFVHKRNAVLKEQRAEIINTLHECSAKIKNASPADKKQIREDCKEKLKEIREKYKDLQSQFKEQLKKLKAQFKSQIKEEKTQNKINEKEIKAQRS